MSRIRRDALANIGVTLRYTDDSVVHTRLYSAQRVNFWRDIFPEHLLKSFMGKAAGDTMVLKFGPNEFIGRRITGSVLNSGRA